MKPFFIFNYDKELISKKADFMDLFLMEAENLEDVFVKEEFNEKALDEGRLPGKSVFNKVSMMAKRASVMR